MHKQKRANGLCNPLTSVNVLYKTLFCIQALTGKHLRPRTCFMAMLHACTRPEAQLPVRSTWDVHGNIRNTLRNQPSREHPQHSAQSTWLRPSSVRAAPPTATGGTQRGTRASILAAQLIRSLLSGREHGLVDPLALPTIGCRAPAGFAGEDPALLPGLAALTVKQGEPPATQQHPV